MKYFYTLFSFLILFFYKTYAQEQETNLFNKITNNISNLDTKIVESLTKKYQKLDEKLTKQTKAYIIKLEQKEQKLQKQLLTKDSVQARIQLVNSQAHFQKLRARLDKANQTQQLTKEYFPQLDSVFSATKFLELNNEQNSSLKVLSQSLAGMQSKLQATADIKKMLKQRKDQLRAQLKNLNVTKQLDAISKETYYYKQQIAEYKLLLKDKDKAQQKLMSFVRENSAFKDFMKKNGLLAKLFPQLGSGSLSNTFPKGLPTYQEILNELQEKFGNNNPLANGNNIGGGGNFLQQQINKAKTSFTKLKDEANKSGKGVSDADMPDFKPNNQKTKSFLQRLEVGMNIQSVKNNKILPTTSDIALTVGYKLNDKSTIGVGLAYKMGWGNGWNDIKLSTQGYGYRTFVDVKLFTNTTAGFGKLFKNLWISGGYELNYLAELENKTNEITKIDYKAWQVSALMGLSKKYNAGKKKAQVQLLYNFLYQKSNPQQQPLIFRVGWGL
ncbi:MAG: hypothetical protein KGZ59_12415 [Chitinophagaceae bacterium]|nr:hypothetical protein [Chitinophagaceae bacterium]